MDEAHDLISAAAAHHRAGRLDEAQVLYRQALHRFPGEPDALHLLGMIELQNGRRHEAIELITQAIAAKPDAADFHNTLGSAWRALGKTRDAIDSFQRAIELRPVSPSAYNNLANALLDEGEVEDAIKVYELAIQLDPEYAEAHNNLGAAKVKQERFTEAAGHYRKAVQLRGDFDEAHLNLAMALGRQGRTEEAIESLRRAIALNPSHCRAHSDLLYLLHYPGTIDQETIFREHLAWATRHAEPLTRAAPPPLNERSATRRLRIGYLSPDFMRHAVAFLIEPMLEAHDHEQVEIFCYSNVPAPDEMTERLRRHADQWRDIRHLSDENAAELIREDRIDILVDLAGHTADNRALVMARKPAPVQMMHFGYPDTTGMAAIDYRITDSLADPPGLTEPYYTESPLRLPHCAWCYQPLDDGPSLNALPASERGFVTFGSLNNLIKVNPFVVRLWSSIMSAVPNSRLVFLLGADPAGEEYFAGQFKAHGIGGDRISFVGRRSRDAYMRLYHDVDIALDPFPYNGGVTTLDSLWMGVPVITLAGQTHVSRVGLSLLTNLGVTETIADSPEHYLQIAIRLARNLPLLSRMRQRLREQMRRSSLYDQVSFTRALEQAYRQAWIRWCRGEPPSHG